MSRPRLSSSPHVYQLKVTLLEVSPAVWRRLLVSSDVTLEELHHLLQETVGWTDSHLHRFTLGERRFGNLRHFEGEDPGLENERRARLDHLVGNGEVLLYEYDFGDGWVHEVRVEKVLELDHRITYPLCTSGARACPPEDCGGPHGYERLLETLADASHEKHDDMLRWVGGYFDPRGFDANRVNRALHRERR